ncbi:hypothetical protein G8A07_11995 [Roseateles sp. DAIF2]|uniref:hypothetical protein n=1 Tax=Roseateles sp. DAIF2 TaxID=2714952 RepID=UPI0018A29F55|nr:hypothetical protein [Roseateles sp. DAIF2]QPF73573.1 hypothetical protein G8A07_11995 [Roseateles sp. DAIF2]
MTNTNQRPSGFGIGHRLVLAMLGLALLLAGLAGERPAVTQLPRVEISGKSLATLAAEGRIERLPRVLVEGRSLEGRRLAAVEAEARTN